MTLQIQITPLRIKVAEEKLSLVDLAVETVPTPVHHSIFSSQEML